MDFLKAIEIERRMTKADERGYCGIRCDDCPLYYKGDGVEMYCDDFKRSRPEEHLKILEKWDKEHPRKTRLQDFLEKYPNAPTNTYNVPLCCVNKIFGNVEICSERASCEICWNTPIEEN